MIIKKLHLEDFRQYVGVTDIDFSSDEDKKMTVIIGKGMAGKTTLIDSIKWIFFGSEADGRGSNYYYNPFNEKVENDCPPNGNIEVKGSVELIHDNVTYVVSRKESKTKRETTFTKPDVVFRIDFKDEDGISQQKKGETASAFMNTIVPKNLIPYLLFKGEHMSRVSDELLRANTSREAEEFRNAVTCLLGFNYYEKAIRHLGKLSTYYDTEIANNNNDSKLANIAAQKNDANYAIESAKKLLEGSDVDGSRGLYFDRDNLNASIEELSNKIAENATAEIKQKRTLEIQKELEENIVKINTKKKKLFTMFSDDSYLLFANNLIGIANETLEHENYVDAGIPMMDDTSIDYILNKMKKCICGKELCEGTEEYKAVLAWKDKLPPVGIGTEIDRHKQFLDTLKDSSERFIKDFSELRKEIYELDNTQSKLFDELQRLNSEIENIPDVSTLKVEEKRLRGQLTDTEVKIKINEKKIQDNKEKLSALDIEQENYKTSDSTIKRLLLYQKYCEAAKTRISNYCKTREPRMRKLLEDTINEFYKKIFPGSNLTLSLNNDYALSITIDDNPVSKSFMASESQRASIVFSFITGVVELAGRTKETEEKEYDIDDNVEAYPLIFDAPTSTFDKDSTVAFSRILSQINEQVIIFVNDKDGEILLDNMSDYLGKRYEIIKVDDFNSNVRGVE